MTKRVAWLCWGLAAAAIIGTGVALIVASGGSLVVAGTAAMSAACGVASTSTALIITSFAFVGSSL